MDQFTDPTRFVPPVAGIADAGAMTDAEASALVSMLLRVGEGRGSAESGRGLTWEHTALSCADAAQNTRPTPTQSALSVGSAVEDGFRSS